jgi:MOSC domain-containing protein YiiM
VDPAVPGRIVQLNRKPKEGRARGLPKRPVPELTITPDGVLGENLTVAGLPAGSLGAGAQVRVEDVVLEVSKACDPCTILYGLPYVGMERGGTFLHAVRGRRGWFARVVRGGTVRVGMQVIVLSGPYRDLPLTEFPP